MGQARGATVSGRGIARAENNVRQRQVALLLPHASDPQFLNLYEHPDVLPHVMHFKHDPFLTSVACWQDGQGSPV